MHLSIDRMTRHHHPAQALGATGGLAALVGWVPTAVSARSAYKVKGEVPEGLLRRSSLEATERGGYVEKLVKQVRMAAASVGTCTTWILPIIILSSILRVWVLIILISVRSLRSQDQVSYLEGIPACGALIVLALSLLTLPCN